MWELSTDYQPALKKQVAEGYLSMKIMTENILIFSLKATFLIIRCMPEIGAPHAEDGKI